VPIRRAEAIRQVALDNHACNTGLSDSVAVSLSAEPLEIDATTFQDQQWMQNGNRQVAVDLQAHSQLSDNFAFETEHAGQNIDVQLLAARTRKVDRRSIRCLIINIWNLSLASGLSCNDLGFGLRAEKIRIDGQLVTFKRGQLDLVVFDPRSERLATH